MFGIYLLTKRKDMGINIRYIRLIICIFATTSEFSKMINHTKNTYLLMNNGSLKIEIKAKQFYAASQRVL